VAVVWQLGECEARLTKAPARIYRRVRPSAARVIVMAMTGRERRALTASAVHRWPTRLAI
jgi:hypothetical protein